MTRPARRTFATALERFAAAAPLRRRTVPSSRASTSVAHVTTIAESLKLLLLNQLQTIGEAGFRVAGVSAPGEAAAALVAHGIRHLPVSFVRASRLTPTSDMKTFTDLVRLFRRERFTIVHTHTAKPDLYAAMAARVAGVPIVVSTLHGFLFHDLMPEPRRQLYMQAARLGTRFCDVVLSQNPEDVNTAIREGVCPAEKIEFLGNGIDLVRFDRARLAPDAIERMRAALNIPRNAPVVGFVGRLVRDKGIVELLEAIRIVRRHHPNVRLVLIGMIDRAKQDVIDPDVVASSDLADTCLFLGHRDDMPELYGLMDLCVLPSYREGFPRAIMEASAMSVPVVATNVRGCRTAVEDGDNGVLVPLHDIPALAAAISTLLANPERRGAMGNAGRRMACARFDERAVFNKVLATYDRLLSRR